MHEILAEPSIILYRGLIIRMLLSIILFGEKIHYHSAIRESLESAYLWEAVNPDLKEGNLFVAL